MLRQLSVYIAVMWLSYTCPVMLKINDVISLCTDTMTGGVWGEMTILGDPELRRLAKSLPSTVLGSRADSTVVKYGYAFQHWKHGRI